MENKLSNTAKEEIKLIERLPDHALRDKISELRSSSNIEIIPVLIRRWNRSKSNELSESLFTFFLDTKSQEAITYFMDAILNDDYKDLRNELISILWQSSLDASEYINDLINIAIEGDYMTIIEVSTVIDSLDSAFYEDEIVGNLNIIHEVIAQEEDEERTKLLTSLCQVVSELYTD